MKNAREAEGGSESNRQRAAFGFECGRDELNLAEFPLAAIADRVPDGQKTLVFEDQIWDSGKRKKITRRLTISASDKFGLPTSLDDEVILGLIQLTKQHRFSNRKVSFSRYQLIQILGWRHEGKSYDRLEKSLKRWLGVTLYYDNAWWDNDAQSWVDENFHILEQLTLYDQERRLEKLRRRSNKVDSSLSTFTWNEVVFRSFQSGYLKSIDLDFYRRLESAAAKRMYRFLDKRFYHKPKWEFDLAEFSCEHVGLSRNYDTGQLKRRLQPAIAELEVLGFLTTLAPSDRFAKSAPGKWRVRFVKRVAPSEVARGGTGDDAGQGAIIGKLTERGVTLAVATELAKQFSDDLIESQIDSFDRRQAAQDQQSLRNPAGYLVKAIRENFNSPQGSTGKAMLPTKRAQRSRKVRPAHAISDGFIKKEVEEYLRSLSNEELEQLEANALKRADAVLLDGYHRSRKTGGLPHEAYRQILREREACRVLSRQTVLANAAN